MAGAVGANISDARSGVGFGSDGLQHRLHVLVGIGRSAGHQRRAVTRAVFAAGYSHAEKVEIFLPQSLFPALRVFEPGVATIDHDVSRFHQRR